ncbi:MAG: hypothetical protein QM691_02720 [Opitutaceae bacterium]
MKASATPVSIQSNADRVRRRTHPEFNRLIDAQTAENVARYRRRPRTDIVNRIRELDREWDIERVLEANASTLALAGVLLGATVSRRWLALPTAVLGFLLLHATQGWCPPLPFLRARGIRTRGEIDQEKFALLRQLKREL